MLEHSWCFNPTSPDELLDTFTAKINLHETQILKLLKHCVIAQHCMFERITQETFIQIVSTGQIYFRHKKLWLTLLDTWNWKNYCWSSNDKYHNYLVKISWLNWRYLFPESLCFCPSIKNQSLSITIEISLNFHLKIFRGQNDKMTRFLFILCYSGAIMTIKTSARNVQIYILYAYKMRLFQ